MFERFRIPQVRTVADYQQMVWSLFPRGQAWTLEERYKAAIGGMLQNTAGLGVEWQNTAGHGDVVQNEANASATAGEPGGVLEAVTWALARELWRLDGRATAVLNERMPGLATELLSAHEAQLGIVPAAGTTTATRRMNAHVKKYTFGAVSTDQFWINFCAQYGVTANVVQGATEQTARRMGAARMGATQPRMGHANQTALLIIEVPSITLPEVMSALIAEAENYKRAHSVLVWRPV